MTTEKQLLCRAGELLAKMTDKQRDLASHYLLGRLIGDLNERDLDHIRKIRERDQ